MTRDLKHLYAAIQDNEVVCFETNLKDFSVQFAKLCPDGRNYDWFFRKFKASAKFTETFGGKLYYFQKVL